MKNLLILLAVLFTSNHILAQTISLSAANDTLCAGDSTEIYAANGSGYVWSPNTGLNVTTGDTVLATPSATITYTVIGMVGMNPDTQHITIEVNNNPVVSITTTDDTICNGSTTSLMAMGAQSYTWSPATGLNTTSGDTVVSSASTNQSYDVVGVDTNGCSGTASASIVVLVKPSITLDVPQFACVNTPTRISASGGDSYKWTPSAAFTVDTGSVVLLSISANTSINVEVTGSNGCSSARGTLVRANSAPAVLILTLDDKDTNRVEICEGDTVALKCLGAGGNGIYDWTGPDLNGNSGINVTANPSMSATYKVVGDNNGCKDSLDFFIDVNASPTISLSQSSGGAAICKDESDTITISSNASLFKWNIAGSQVVTSDKEKAVAPGITSTVLVTAISDENCENQSQIVVLVDTTCGEALNTEELALNTQLITRVQGNQFQWELKTNSNKSLSLTLIDMTGKILHETSMVNNERVLSPSLKKGLYLISISDNNGLIETRKAVIH